MKPPQKWMTIGIFETPSKDDSELKYGKFGFFLASKIQTPSEYEIYQDNLRSLFQHIQDPELVGNFYFIDDSKPEFRHGLQSSLKKWMDARFPQSHRMEVLDNDSFHQAANKAWALAQEEYAIWIHSDFRVIQDLPLGTFRQAFLKYPEIYLIYLRVRGLFGYNDEQPALKKTYPWYQDYSDDFQETWFYRNREGRIFSLPQKLYEKQKAKQLPKEKWGTELIPRMLDRQNTLWTPKAPAVFLESYPSHESFAWGGTVQRVSAFKPYLPIPSRYQKRPAADQEAYFWETDLDGEYYSAYLNLQAFTICHQDSNRPLQNYPPKYWPAFLERNSTPIVFSGPYPVGFNQKTKAFRLYHRFALTALRRKIKQKYEFLRIQYLVARSRTWRKIKNLAGIL